MAELIDKGALILHLKKIVSRESASDNASAGERRISEMVVSVILNCIEAVAEQPTTTEADIRAKAIDEFAEKMNKKITDFVLEHQSQLTFVSGVSMGWKFVDEIAEQLKGE